MLKGSDMVYRIEAMYFLHFGNKNPDLVVCKDCVDYKLGLCCGGADSVLDCMYDKAGKCEIFSNI